MIGLGWRSTWFCLCSFLVCLSGIASSRAADLSPVDLLNRGSIGKVAVSADGRLFAVTVRRALTALEPQTIPTFFGDDLTDIVIENASGIVATLRAKQYGFQSFFRPQWSPDGSHLLFLGYQAIGEQANYVNLFDYSATTGHISRLTAEDVSPYDVACPIFIDAAHVLCATGERGQPDDYLENAHPNPKAGAARLIAAQSGKVVTAVPVIDGRILHGGHLWFMDIRSPQTAQNVSSGRYLDIETGPSNGCAVALRLTGIARINPTGPLYFASAPGRINPLLKMYVARPPYNHWYNVPAPGSVDFQSTYWSNNGTRFAFSSTDPTSDLHYVTIATCRGTARTIPTEINELYGFRASFAFLGEEQVIFKSAIDPLQPWKSCNVYLTSCHRDPLLVSSDRVVQQNNRSLLILRGTTLVRVSLLGGPSKTILRGVEHLIPDLQSIDDIVSRTESDKATTASRLEGTYVATKGGVFHIDGMDRAQRLYVVDDGITGIVALEGHSVLYLRQDRELNKRLAIALSSGRGKTVLATTFPSSVRMPRHILLRYNDLRGVPRIAWLLLPPDASKHPLPTITLVYRDLINTSVFSAWHAVYDGEYTSLEALCGYGYAILIPSIPGLNYTHIKANPRTDVLQGVLPAIKAAIATGYVDKHRLALMGHSNGGYTTLALLTGTHIFKTAIASNGFSDPISHWGTFSYPERYTADDPIGDRHFGIFWAEYTQGQYGVPPWADPEQYLNNSPVLWANRITTPLLLFHGDIDTISIAQSEEMYSALYRQGKRVRFIRFYGENHVLGSRANILAFWKAVLTWLRETL